MVAEFNVMQHHLDAPRAPPPGGRVVLSRLKPGTSVLGARAPSVKLVLEGEELYQIDGRTLRVEPGQFLYLDSGADCLGVNKTETTGMCLMLPLTAAAAGEWRDIGALGRAVVLSTRTSTAGRSLAGYAREIARNPALGEVLAPQIVSRVGDALAEPLAESRAAIENLKAAKPSTRQELYRRLDRARAHLHDRLDRMVSLAELASVANLSQFHLARYFKLAFGEAPIAYHRALRLARAAEFLASGAGSVAEAAEMAGYSDQTALSHAFRKRYGMAPLQWAMANRRS